MTQILNVQSSPNLQFSASRSTAAAYLERYAEMQPDTVVAELDLVLNPPPHLSTDHLGAFFAAPEHHSPANAAALDASERYLEQFLASDIVVVGTPMHNLGIPSVLKSWIDNILRVGRTFRYGEQGEVVGLVTEPKKIVIVLSSGGIYSQGPLAPMDHASTYLTAVFGFMGITDVSVVRAEGMNMGAEMANRGLAKATQAARSLADMGAGLAASRKFA